MDIEARLTETFRQVFERDDITLFREMTAADLTEWDSLAHINLIMEIEENFGLRFNVDDIVDLKNVGEMIDLIERKVKTGPA